MTPNGNPIDNPFEKFSAACQDSGLSSALDELADYLIGQERFHELFEVRKLQLRERLQLPVGHWQPIHDLPAEQGRKLEAGLLEICREVGTQLFRSGDVAGGWQYLEPVGDRSEAVCLLRETPVTDENVEALIQVSIGHGLDPELGFRLVLDRFGTCSSITTFESQLAGQPIEARRDAARLLVNHLHTELTQRVAESIRQREGDSAPQEPETASLPALLAGRDWLFEGLSHHIDTTHLASTVKISKILEEETAIRQALELAGYGQRLHKDFHYAGQKPFADIHADTTSFLKALLKIDAAEEIGRLRRAATGDAETGSLDSAAWYIYLLDRLGHGEEATRAYFELVHARLANSMLSEDVCPGLLTLVSRHGEFEIAKTALLKLGDLTGYATVLAIESQSG